MQIWEMTRSEIGVGTPPIVPDPPRPLTKLYGPRWMDRPNAAELKKEFTRQASARSKALKEYKAYVERSNRHFAAVKDALARGERVPQAVIRDYPYLKENGGNPGTRKPTIYEALYEKLGRAPTNAELKADVERIKTEALVEAAGKGKLKHQRGRRKNAYHKPRNPLQVGDKVKYQSEFLRNIGAYTGSMGPARGTITALSYFDGTWDGGERQKRGESVLADIHWGKHHGELPERVNVANLIKASTPNPKSNPGERIYGVGDSHGPSGPDGQAGLTQAEAVAIQKKKPWLYIFKKTSSGNWSFVTVKRNNPADTAAEMYEKFHGRESGEVIEVKEREHYHEHLSALGVLVEIKVKTKSGYKVEIGFASDAVAGAENPHKFDIDGISSWSPMSTPATATVEGHGVVSSLPGYDDHGNRLTGREANSDWGFGGKALVLSPVQQKRLHHYYARLRRDVQFTVAGKQNPKGGVKGWLGRRGKAIAGVGDNYLKSFKKTFINPGTYHYPYVVQIKNRTSHPTLGDWSDSMHSYKKLEAAKKSARDFAADTGSKTRVVHWQSRRVEYEFTPKVSKSNPPVTKAPKYKVGQKVALGKGFPEFQVGWPAEIDHVFDFSGEDGSRMYSVKFIHIPNYGRGGSGWLNVSEKNLVPLKKGGKKSNPDHDTSGYTVLASNENGDQLYIEGGDQSLDLAAIHMDGKWVHDSIVIGDILEITYRTQKDFDKFETIDYFHKLGEVTGKMPQLRYDNLNQKLYIDGGQYFIKKPMIGTSPGLEN